MEFLKSDIFLYVTIGFVLLMCLKIYSDSELYNLKCIISSVDGNKYCVREREKEQDASNLLATVTQKCKKIVEYMEKNHPNDQRVQRLVKGFNPKKISETLPTSELTAYSENKGEKIAFCLNKKKHDDTQLIDLNTLTFVALHELSHIMTTSIGHKQDFWNNFKYLLDYKNSPKPYCGMTITDNPYYDL
jgi:hypothetical protein